MTLHMNQTEFLRKSFQELYGTLPRIFRAPGRVNLIGEHTDYNDGFVMPVAIDLSTWIGISVRPDSIIRTHSFNFKETVEIDLNSVPAHPKKHWSDYVHGVAVVLLQSGYHLKGADLLIKGEVPIGSGLSSSAAIEVATALALLANSGHEVERVHLAKLCQRAENEFVGMRCGIMDQFISCCAKEDRALILDCRSLSYNLLPMQSEIRLVICNTMVNHELASGEYNKRRAECEEAVHRLQKVLPGIRALRDLSLQDLETHRGLLPDVTYKRALHVVTENQRVLDAAEALERKDPKTFGRLMYNSHQSLKENYEVSCRELDILVELAREVDGVFGSRMTGGGFGGCTITLLEASQIVEFQEAIAPRYQRATGLHPEIYACTAATGAEELTSL